MEKLQLNNITKRFGEELILDDVSLAVANNELVALLGESGSGKSTLLRIIAGFESAEKGEIIIAEQTVASDSVFLKPEDRSVGFIFQDYALFPHLSVERNISYGLKGKSDAEKAKLNQLLKVFELEEVRSKKPSKLSGGQQQRVAIARALAVQPVLLLLDEPFSNLDQSLRGKVRKEIQRIKEEFETPMLLVTHDPDDALELADKIAVLQNGKIVQFDTPEKIYRQPLNQYVADLFGPNFIVDNLFFRQENIDLNGNKYSGKVTALKKSPRGHLIEFIVDNQILKIVTNQPVTFHEGDEITFSLSD
jgi:iron(III) transport system ATP-binding protein